MNDIIIRVNIIYKRILISYGDARLAKFLSMYQ